MIKNPRAALRRHGVYLITGGLGDLGLAISRHLARAYKASVILISRTPVPPRKEWSAILERGSDEDRIVRMIRGIARIESAGGKVMVGAADVSNLAQMRAVVREAVKKFGTIHGVIHAAGISGLNSDWAEDCRRTRFGHAAKTSGVGRARADFRQSKSRFYGAILIGGCLVGARRTGRLRSGQRLSGRIRDRDVGQGSLAGNLDQLGYVA